MQAQEKLILIDPDMRRRAAVTHCLAAAAIHVEPFEDLAELSRAWPREGIILASDEGDLVRTLLTAMAEHGNWLPLVAFAPLPSTPRVVQAVIAGAIDYLEWPFDVVTIQAAIELARSSADGIGNARLREAMARSRIQKLTRREREVLAGVADGLSNRLIGERLAISPRTVEIHRANMMTKLGARHAAEAVRLKLEAKLEPKLRA
jgi:two-component system, LuxR family, response regulator FixJ